MRFLSAFLVSVIALFSLTAMSQNAAAATPSITSINPTTIATTAAANSTYPNYTAQSAVISGSGLGSVTSIQIGNWTIQGADINNVVYLNTAGSVGFYLPTAASAGLSSGGNASVTVTTAQGTSNALTLSYGSPKFSLPSASGPTSGTVTINGTGLSTNDSYTVCFGSNSCISSIHTLNGSSFSVPLPSGSNAPVAGTTVTVTVTDTTTSTSLTASGSASYTFYGQPTVTGVSPNSGAASTANTITVTGTNFVSGATVAFVQTAGSTPGTNVSVTSATSLTVTTPTSISAGTPTDVVVTTPGGPSAKTAADTYTFTQGNSTKPPVLFFGSYAPSATQLGAHGITSTGATFDTTYSVDVQNPSATQTLTNVSASFTFPNGLTPSSVSGSDSCHSTISGQTVSFSGQIFSADQPVGCTVSINIIASSTGSYGDPTVTSLSSAESGSVSSPSIAAPNGTLVVSGGPAVTALSPNTGTSTGGYQVTIQASGLTSLSPGAPYTVTVGKASVPATVNISGGLTVTSWPSQTAAGSATPTVSIGGGKGVQFAYGSVPTVTAVSPSIGPIAGGNTVTITGTGFTSATAVTFSGAAASSFTVVSDTQITAIAPAHNEGGTYIQVATAAGISTAVQGSYYFFAGIPTISSVTPASGSPNGGDTVTINGAHFYGSPTVTIGGAQATVTSITSTQLSVVTPAHAAGAVDVVVTTGGGSATGTAAFTYSVTPPTVTGLSKQSTFVGDTIFITGTNFASGVTVKFGTVPATTSAFLSATSLSATVPPGSGTVDVTVTGAGGTSAVTNADKFTYTGTSSGGLSVSASYSQSPISPNGTSTLTLTLSNGNATSLTSAAGSFDLSPTGINGAIGGTCGTVTGSAKTLSFTGATIAANATCTLTAVVTPGGLLGAPLPRPTLTAFSSDQTGALTSFPSVTGTALTSAILLPAVTATYKNGTTTAVQLDASVLSGFNGAAFALGTSSTGPFSASVQLADGATASVSGSTVSFTPPANDQAVETLYYVFQAGSQTTLSSTITLSPGQQIAAPTLTAFATTVSQGASTVSINVATLGAATGSPTGYSVARTSSGPFAASAQTSANGSVSITAQGVATYSPSTASFTGTDTFYAQATNAGGNAAPVAVTVNVVGLAVSLTGSGATQGVALTGYKVIASGGTAPYTCQLANGSQMPAGLALNTDCTITGTPTASGSNLTFSVQVSDASSPAVTKTSQLALSIAQPTVAPTLTAFSVSIAENSSGNAINVAQLGAAQGTTTGYAVSATSAGSFGSSASTSHGSVSISSAGSASYTPTAGYNGKDTFYVTASNGSLTSSPVAVTVTVTPATLTVSLRGTGATINSPLSNFSIVVSGGIAPYSCQLAGGRLPSGVVLSPSCGLSGTPTATGTFSFTVTVSDASTPVVTQTSGALSLVVNTSRPDPSKDTEVIGLVTAQTQVAEQFADTQIQNFNNRLEQMHGDGYVQDSFGVSLTDGLGQDTDATRSFADADPALQRAQSADNATALAMKKADQESDARTKAADDKIKKAAIDRAFSFWTAGAIQIGRLHNNNTASTSDLTTTGLSAGIDYRFSQFLSIGFGLGYGLNSSDIGTNGTTTTGRNYDAVLYGSIRPTAASFIDLVAGAGILDFTSNRYITGVGGFANGRRAGFEYFGSITSGADFKMKSYTLTPYVRLEGKKGTLNAFDENAPGFWSLHYDKETFSTASVNLGLKAAIKLKNDLEFARPFFRAEFQHDLVNNANAGVTYVDLVSSGLDYTIAMPGSNTNRVMLGAGADMTLDDFKLTLEYLNTFATGSSYDNSTLTVHVTKAF